MPQGALPPSRLTTTPRRWAASGRGCAAPPFSREREKAELDSRGTAQVACWGQERGEPWKLIQAPGGSEVARVDQAPVQYAYAPCIMHHAPWNSNQE